MNFQKVEELVRKSQQPLVDQRLESLKLPGEERRNYHRFLYYLTKARQPAVCLELGIQWGTAMIHMAEASPELVIGIDIIRTKRLAMLNNYPNCVFLNEDSTLESTKDEVVDFIERVGKIGIVYQDSSHKYVDSIREWELYSPLLDDNAIWICDDITSAFYNPDYDPPGLGMVQYFEQLPGEKRLYQDALHKGNTQGVILL